MPDDTPQLTWADILADDPLIEEGIWEDIVIDSDYSDEDFQSIADESATDHTTSTQASSCAEDNMAAFANSFIVTQDDAALDVVYAAQTHIRQLEIDKHVAGHTEISDYQAIREILLMLRGLPTALFSVDVDHRICARPGLCTKNSEPSTFNQIMGDFADIGTQLNRLRALAASPANNELLQRLRQLLQREIETLENSLVAVEQRFLTAKAEVVVSLLGILSEVRDLSTPIMCLARAVLNEASDTRAWVVLDSLFEVACEVQLGGGSEEFKCVAGVFLGCLDIYLGPVQLWMTQGMLRDDSDTLFVRPTEEEVDRGRLWHSCFKPSIRSDGTVDAPKFMQKVVNQIFTAGKNVMFLNALQGSNEECGADRVKVEGFGTISKAQSPGVSLLPFAGTFEIELQQWIKSLQTHTLRTLRETMFTRCGLGNVVDVVDYVFLARDGAQFQHFADGIFARIDRKRTPDRFILTDLARSTFGSLEPVDEESISVRLYPKSSEPALRTSPMETLDRVQVDYIISWPLRNVIKDFTTCQRAFTAALCVYRAEYLLTKQQWAIQAANKQSSHSLGPALVLRQRLVWLISTVRGYTSENVAVAMQQLRTDLQKTTDLDGMASAYDEFQRRLEARLLLHKNVRPIYQSLLGLLNICEDFSELWTKNIEESCNTTNAGNFASRQRTKHPDSQSDCSDDGTDEESEIQQRPVHNIPDLSREYARQLHFLIAGLRGVSRVDGEPAWLTLAERLQLGADHLGPG